MSDLADIVIRVDSSQLNSAAGATEELRRSTLNLVGSVDRVAAAQIGHANAMRTLQNAVRTGIITQQEMARTTTSLTQRLEAQGLTINNLGQVVQRNTGIFRRFGSSGMQQVGYQVGDFAVQVQGGTSALVALGQQGSQLLGIFGAGGAIAGAFLAIGTALLNAYTNAKKFRDAAGNLKTGVSELRSEIELLQSGTQGLTKEFGNMTGGLERTVRLIATVSLANAFKEARTQLAALTQSMYTSTAPIMNSTIWAQTEQSAKGYQRNFGMSSSQATQMADMELALARAKTDKERLDLLNKMNAELSKQISSGAVISDQGYEYVKNMALAQQGLQTVVNLQGVLGDTSKAQIETERQKSNVISSQNALEDASKLIAMQKLDALTKQREEYLRHLGITKDLANAEKEAAGMLEGKNSVAKNLQDQAIKAKLEEFRLAKEREKAEQAAADKANYLKGVFHAMAGETSAISVSLGGWAGELVAATNAAKTLADNLGVSLSAAQGIVALGKGKAEHGAEIYDPRSPNYIKGAGTFAEISAGAHPVSTYGQPVKDKTSPTGAGGGGVDKVQALLDSLKTQTEVTNAWYEESQTTLQSASDKELEILGGKEEAKLRLLNEYRQKQYEAQQAQSQLLYQAQAGMYGALGDLLSQFGAKSKGAAVAALAIQKGLSIAQIIANTAAAQMRALAELGPIAGSAMAAKIGLMGKLQVGLVAATGLMQAGSIMSGGASGSGSSGSGSGHSSVGTTASTQTVAPQVVMIQGLKPTDVFTGEQLSTLFDSLYKENRNRGMVFQVAR